MKQKTDERSFRDPVCGMEVSRITAVDEFEYGGKVYYFCSSACRKSFEENPDEYVRRHRQHGMNQAQAHNSSTK